MTLVGNICAPLGILSTFSFNLVIQLSTSKNEINLFNNHVLIVAPETFAPAGATTPSAEFLLANRYFGLLIHNPFTKWAATWEIITSDVHLKNSNQPVHQCCLMRVRCPYEETLHYCLSEMHPVKVLIRLQMCRLIWTVAGRRCPQVRFLNQTQ